MLDSQKTQLYYIYIYKIYIHRMMVTADQLHVSALYIGHRQAVL